MTMNNGWSGQNAIDGHISLANRPICEVSQVDRIKNDSLSNANEEGNEMAESPA